MIDIKTNNKGDLVVGKQEEYPRLNIKWVRSEHPSFRLLFKSGRAMEEPTQRTSEQLGIQFGLGVREKRKRCMTVLHDDELQQRVTTRLRTELGDISGDPEYGTKLYKQKHQDIIDAAVQKAVRDIVMDAVIDILETPDVKVRKDKTNGPFFCQNLNVYVYDGKKEIYNFVLEE